MAARRTFSAMAALPLLLLLLLLLTGLGTEAKVGRAVRFVCLGAESREPHQN